MGLHVTMWTAQGFVQQNVEATQQLMYAQLSTVHDGYESKLQMLL
jgi:hypothetical protein